ncbi:MAG: hypothetical protein ACR2IQ_00625 [Minisyncoccia bacterium]
METSEQYLEKIKNSDLSTKTKQAIFTLIGDKELTQQLKDQSKAIIASEIEEETRDMFEEVDESDMKTSIPNGFVEEDESKVVDSESSETEEI